MRGDTGHLHLEDADATVDGIQAAQLLLDFHSAGQQIVAVGLLHLLLNRLRLPIQGLNLASDLQYFGS